MLTACMDNQTAVYATLRIVVIHTSPVLLKNSGPLATLPNVVSTPNADKALDELIVCALLDSEEIPMWNVLTSTNA